MALSRADRRRWLATRPRIVREILKRWPLDSVVTDGVQRFFVAGATEGGSLIITPINPNVDYEGAHAARRHCCIDCLKAGRLHFVERAEP
jgi:hypothetical protein